MMNKYYNEGIIGYKKRLVSFDGKGQMIRLFDGIKQFVDFFHTGISVNNSHTIWLHSDVNNSYNQYYTENTNILNTEILNKYFNLKITQTDFVSMDGLLIKKYIFKNNNTETLNLDFLIYSKVIGATGYFKDNTLIQYTHDNKFSITSKKQVLNHQINNNKENINTGKIGGKDYIGMSSDSSVSYNVGTLKSGEEKEIDIFIYIDDCDLKKIDANLELEKTKKYWEKYLSAHQNITFPEKNTNAEEIYKRSILLFPLLINEETGGILASVEIDESMTKCGGYGYCWPRDSEWITKAFDLCNMKKESENFYKNFCKNTQLKNGMWEQRYYSDGKLAPAWGYQIDETAVIITGVWNKYEISKEEKFLKDNLKMCEKASDFLQKYVEDVLSNTNKVQPSYDIWEEREGIHTYSLCAIYGAFDAMAKIYDAVFETFKNNRLKQDKILAEQEKFKRYFYDMKGYILKYLFDDKKKIFLRNNLDKKVDISLLGLVTPFKVFEANDKRILNTIEQIDLKLRTYSGGYKRYEDDTYIGGNPWPIANMWLAKYYIDAKSKKKAKELMNFVINSASKHGFLGEQVNNATMEPAWVVGLCWSHAMYVIILEELM